MAIVMASFLGALGGTISGLFLLMLLRKLALVWKKHADQKLPKKIVHRGLIVVAGPFVLALFSVARIFYASQTGHDFAQVVLLAFYGVAGLYSLFMSAFIFTLFEHLYKLTDFRIKKQNDFFDV